MTATTNSIVTNKRLKGVVTNSYGNVTNEAFVLPSLGLVDNWDASIHESITVATGVSSWESQVVGGHPLVQATGADQPVYDSATNSITFDGVSDFLKTAGFTLNQPDTIYIVYKPVSWSVNTFVLDGLGAGTRQAIAQTGTTPTQSMYAGASFVAANNNLAVGASGVNAVIFNGAASSLKVNNTAETTGNPGAHNADGITLGANFSGAAWSNIEVYEIAVYNVAHDAAEQEYIIKGLMGKHSI